MKSRPSVHFVEIKETWQKKFLRQALKGHRLVFLEGTAGAEASNLRGAEVLSVFIQSQVDAKALKGMPRLRFIATRSTGFDHIDTAASKRRGIPVSNVPAYGENTVAEHTFALILSLSRHLRKAYLRAMQNDFSLDGLMGFDLKGKTLGIVGTGRIGLHVARIGVAFGMDVVAHDVHPNGFMAEVMGFRYAPLDEVLGPADILTLHVPLMESTRHLIDDKAIRKMRKGSLLVNTSRGGLVKTAALIRALDEKHLAGAGLDVLEEEEFLFEDLRLSGLPPGDSKWGRIETSLRNHQLLHRENVIFTPHMAFYSKEAVQRILQTTADNILAFLDGRPARRVN